MTEPAIMAITVRGSMADVRKGSWSWVPDSGVLSCGDHSVVIERRIEYAAVRPVAKKSINIMTGLVGLERLVSRIASFE